jgi:hypothetical protein
MTPADKIRAYIQDIEADLPEQYDVIAAATLRGLRKALAIAEAEPPEYLVRALDGNGR